MTEIVTYTRALTIKNSQSQILEILEKIGKENNELVKLDRAKKRSQNVQQLVGNIRDIVFSFGERFTVEAEPIKSVRMIKYEELFEKKSSEALGVNSGTFSTVFIREFRGQKVAVNVRNTKEASIQREVAILRTIRHDNILNFRGWGQHNDKLFLVTEHLEKNLLNYINEQGEKGLLPRTTWEIAKQIAQAMFFLHNLEIAVVHGDLKPEKIWVDARPFIPKVKLCDFGPFSHDYLERQTLENDTVPKTHFKADEYEEAKTMNDLMQFDVAAFGLVVFHMSTGFSFYANRGYGITSLLHKIDGKYMIKKIPCPPDIHDSVLNDLVKKTCKKHSERPSFREICDGFFGKDIKNPFNLSQKGKFFKYGFLKDTRIFVADSIVKDAKSPGDRMEGEPPGYRSVDLICSVVVGEPYKFPEDDIRRRRQDIDQDLVPKEINKNNVIALMDLISFREGEQEAQQIELRMQEMEYRHHLITEMLWGELDFERKKLEHNIPSQVNRIYTTSFQLHVAVLTNEGPGKKKFVFNRISGPSNVGSIGNFVCGYLEICSIQDYLSETEVRNLVPNFDKKKKYVSLINTATRGLKEKLGLILQGKEKEAITLNTVYFDFDTHEWGMAGFVDLTSEKICKQHPCNLEALNVEKSDIHGVDFDLHTMVEWIRQNQNKLENSAKLVAVEVLEAFYGVAVVTNEFRK